ncbi:Nucleoside diphosphate kinase [Bienertia sinuspersici]
MKELVTQEKAHSNYNRVFRFNNYQKQQSGTTHGLLEKLKILQTRIVLSTMLAMFATKDAKRAQEQRSFVDNHIADLQDKIFKIEMTTYMLGENTQQLRWKAKRIVEAQS